MVVVEPQYRSTLNAQGLAGEQVRGNYRELRRCIVRRTRTATRVTQAMEEWSRPDPEHVGRKM